MKKIIIMALGLSSYTLAMQVAQKQESYLDILPQELRQEIDRFSTEFKDVNELVELVQRMKEVSERSSSSSFIEALNSLQQQLELINCADYNNALVTVKELSKDKDLQFLFNNPDFNRILISELDRKCCKESKRSFYSSMAKDIAKEINTPGALEWLRQLDFIWAATMGTIKVVKEFLSMGINVNARDIDGCTALMEAVIIGHKDIVEILLSAGSDIDSQDELGDTALIEAAGNDQLDVGTQNDLAEIGKLLITHGANVNIKNKDGYTALMNAMKGNYNKSLVKLLIKAGAGVNIQDKKGKTALILAVKNRDCNKSWVKLLIKAGADVNIQDKEGNTALINAVKNNCYDGVEYLLDKGAEIDIQDKNGMTALMWAAKKGYAKIAEELIRGATVINDKRFVIYIPRSLSPDIDIQNVDGMTALAIANAQIRETGITGPKKESYQYIISLLLDKEKKE